MSDMSSKELIKHIEIILDRISKKEDSLRLGLHYRDAADLLPRILCELLEIEAALKRICELQPKALSYIRREGFIFEVDGDHKYLAEWQELAFSLYCDLCEANWICRGVLEEEET